MAGKQHVMSKQPRTDFFWSEEREPHLERRREILKAHPEVKKLFGKNPYLPFSTISMVIVQVVVAFFIHKVFLLGIGWGIVAFIAATYFIGASIAHALFLAIHEITQRFSL